MMNKSTLVKRSLSVLTGCCLAAGVALMLSGCQSKNKQPAENQSQELIKSKKDLSHIKVGYCSPSLNAPFYVALSDAIRQNVGDYKMSFVSVDGQDDISKQIKGVEDLISKGVNVIVLNPLDPKALVPTVNAAAKSGIPVFIVDSYIDPSARYVTSVMADNQGNGELLGSWAAEKLKGTPIHMALISGAQGNPVGREKRLGFMRGVIDQQLISEGHAALSVASQGWGNWTISGGLKAAEDILVAHPDINLVVAENDAMAMGALRAINESKKGSPILVVGFDGQKDALKLIKDGTLGATALNSPGALAKLTVQSIVEYENGAVGTGKVIHTKAVLINSSNVDKYYDPNAPF